MADSNQVAVSNGGAALLQFFFGSPDSQTRKALERLALVGKRIDIMENRGPGDLEILHQLRPPRGAKIGKHDFAPEFGLKLRIESGHMTHNMVSVPIMIYGFHDNSGPDAMLGFVSHDFSHNLRRAGAEVESEHLLVLLQYGASGRRRGFVLLAPELVKSIEKFYHVMRDLPDEEDE